MTESGKTTLAKRLINSARNSSGMKSIVLDPLRDPAFNADFQTADPDEFLERVFNSESCLVVVDEGAQMIGRYEGPMLKLATMGRHWGHTCIFLSQRPMQINLTVRNQLSAVALFCSSFDDGKTMSKEFNENELLNCTSLKRGEYYYKMRFKNVEKRKLF